jgi:murein DD-endopeptidase MepM/ murein hydrolase activator NlpD
VIGVLRVLGMVVGGGMVWVVAASQVPSHLKLPVAGVVVGAVISQPFGCTSLELEPIAPFCPGRHIHTGIDLAAATGTPVRSATSGIARVGFDPNGAGNYVVVTVDAHVRVLYCHLSSIRVVSGKAVNAGDVIGAIGSTGWSTGPHLHLEIQRDGTSIDPAVWLAS